MSLILAIEPDRWQAAQLAGVFKRHVHAELILADTTERAIGAIGTRVPDLILVPALLSPQDDAALAAALRVIATAAHVQMLTIPVLAAPQSEPAPKGGVFSVLRRDKKGPSPSGCDPIVFAEQVRSYLEHAIEKRTDEVEAIAEPAHATTLEEPIALREVLPPTAERMPPQIAGERLLAIAEAPPPEPPFEWIDEPPAKGLQDTPLDLAETSACAVEEPIVVPAFGEATPAEVTPMVFAEEMLLAAAETPAAIEEEMPLAGADEMSLAVAGDTPAPEIEDLSDDIDLSNELEAVAELDGNDRFELSADLVDHFMIDEPAEPVGYFVLDAVAERDAQPAAIAAPVISNVMVDVLDGVDETIAEDSRIAPADVMTELWTPLELEAAWVWPDLEGIPSEMPLEMIADGDAISPVAAAEVAASVEFGEFMQLVEPETAVGEGAILDRLVAQPELDVPEVVVSRPAAAVTSQEPEWVELIESLRLDIERLRAEPAAPAPARTPMPLPMPMPMPMRGIDPSVRRPKRVLPKREAIQDEWGFFDPQQCGFAALLAKLEEVTGASEDQPIKTSA